MKTALLVLVSLFCSAALAGACPDFFGNYQERDLDSETNKISQTGCEKLTVAKRFGIGQPTYTFEYIVDGKRRAGELGIFWVAYWKDASFVLEPWSKEQGGEMLGDREVWTLVKEGQETVLVRQVIDPRDSVVVSETRLKKVN